jgi:hypothetical protein
MTQHQLKKFKIRLYLISKNSKQKILKELQKIFQNAILLDLQNDIITSFIKIGFKDMDYSNVKCFEIENYNSASQLYQHKKQSIQRGTFFDYPNNDQLLTDLENKIISDVAKNSDLKLSYNYQLFSMPPGNGIGTFINIDHIYLIIFYNACLKN